jgi:hypothetical protein
VGLYVAALPAGCAQLSEHSNTQLQNQKARIFCVQFTLQMLPKNKKMPAPLKIHVHGWGEFVKPPAGAGINNSA